MLALVQNGNTCPLGESGRAQVVVTVKIKRDGSLLSAGVKQSSGSTERDTAALDGVKRTIEFPSVRSEIYPGIQVFEFDLPVKF